MESRIDQIAKAVNGVFKAAGKDISITADAFTGEKEIFFADRGVFWALAEGENLTIDEPIFDDKKELRFVHFRRDGVSFKTLSSLEELENEHDL